jgi:hypothetical protein
MKISLEKSRAKRKRIKEGDFGWYNSDQRRAFLNHNSDMSVFALRIKNLLALYS